MKARIEIAEATYINMGLGRQPEINGGMENEKSHSRLYTSRSSKILENFSISTIISIFVVWKKNMKYGWELL